MHDTETYASFQSPSEPNAIHFVSDDDLLFRTRELTRHETELTIVTIQHLDEIERRELYVKRGYPSLFEYVVRELHFSKGCTWRRIMVMKLCREVPGIADKLRSGELNLTTASQLQNAIEKRARRVAREAAREAASERANEPASVPPAGVVPLPAGATPTQGAAADSAAGESVSAEVPPPRAGVAGVAGVAAAAGLGPAQAVAAGAAAVAAAASGTVRAPVGATATLPTAEQSAAGQSPAGGSATAGPLTLGEAAGAVPLPAGGAASALPASATPWLAPGAIRESAPAPPAAAPPSAWTLDQKVELVDLVANKSARETEKLLAELEPELGQPREQQRALGGGRYAVRVILDQASVDTIAKLKGWLSHVNPGFTTGQLLAYLLQQAERKYDPMRERGRGQRGAATKRGAAAPARHAEASEPHLGVTDERRATGSAPGAVASKASSSTAAAGASGEGMPASEAARRTVAARPVAGVPAPDPAAADSADASSTALAPAAADPSGALAGGSAQNRRTQPVPAPDTSRSGATATGSAQNQQPPRVPDPSRNRTPHQPTGSPDTGLPASAPAAAAPSGALAGGSAQNRRTQPVPVPGSEQKRRGSTGSAQNQQAAAATGPRQRAEAARLHRFGAEPAGAAGGKR